MIEQGHKRAEGREAVAASPSDRLLERLAELVGANANVQTVFGQPVRHEGVTVIPVARVRWGFGGGGGLSEAPPSGPASGSGGGGGVAADPIGYLELRSEGSLFRPIRDPYPSPALVFLSGLSAALVIRALARLVGARLR